jgi:hypothetical protein
MGKTKQTTRAFSSMKRGFYPDFAGNPIRDRQPLRFPFPSGNRSLMETVWTTTGGNQKLSDEFQRKGSANQCPKKASPKNNRPSLHPAVCKNFDRARDH